MPVAGRLSKPTRPTRARPSASSGGSKSVRNFETTEKSSVGPQRRRPRRTIANRIRDPLSSGHGYSPAITRVLIDIPQVGSVVPREVQLKQPVVLPELDDGSGAGGSGTAGRVSKPGGPAAAGGRR